MSDYRCTMKDKLRQIVIYRIDSGILGVKKQKVIYFSLAFFSLTEKNGFHKKKLITKIFWKKMNITNVWI